MFFFIYKFNYIKIPSLVQIILLLRYICNNYEITAENKALLRGLGNNRPFSNSNQPVMNCFNTMIIANKSIILAELKDVKKIFL